MKGTYESRISGRGLVSLSYALVQRDSTDWRWIISRYATRSSSQWTCVKWYFIGSAKKHSEGYDEDLAKKEIHESGT